MTPWILPQRIDARSIGPRRLRLLRLAPAGTCPPGPRAGITGWRLLGAMSRDLPGALAIWKAQYGDLVHLRLWPEHEIVVSDPALARELLCARPRLAEMRCAYNVFRYA